MKGRTRCADASHFVQSFCEIMSEGTDAPPPRRYERPLMDLKRHCTMGPAVDCRLLQRPSLAVWVGFLQESYRVLRAQ
jgi:hypothetical protein